MMRAYCGWAVSVLVLAAGAFAQAPQAQDRASSESHFTLWQLPEQTHSQQMSYVLRTSGGKIVVIDGGETGDAPYLRGFLAAMGNQVDFWFITHPHSDHTNAPTAILKDPKGIKIGKFYGSYPDETWLRTYSLGEDIPPLNDFVTAFKNAGTTVTEVMPGDVLELDGVRFEILAGKNPEILTNGINNQSLVMRVSDSHKSVLFTGDLGPEASMKVLASKYRDKLRADYVQMAHHGQAGATEEFYKAVQPKACLWPTPKWLWDNDKGEGKGSGPWQTLTTRAWMEKLGVREHYVSNEGLQRID